MNRFTLIGPDGKPFSSPVKGALGGNRRTRVYGRMDCKAASRSLAAGTYQKNRVFFVDEATARAAGYRPCGSCMRGKEAEFALGAFSAPAI